METSANRQFILKRKKEIKKIELASMIVLVKAAPTKFWADAISPSSLDATDPTCRFS